MTIYLIKNNTPYYPNNIANRKSFPNNERGTHILLGSQIYLKRGLNNILTRGDNHLIGRLQDAFNYFTSEFKQIRELLKILINCQFPHMDGSLHTDNTNNSSNQTTYVLMLASDYSEKLEGGGFYHKPSDQLIDFKMGRLVEFNAAEIHQGLSFKNKSVIRFSVAWTCNNLN